jgi:hypothetical protein
MLGAAACSVGRATDEDMEAAASLMFAEYACADQSKSASMHAQHKGASTVKRLGIREVI